MGEDELDDDFFGAVEERVNRRKWERQMLRALAKHAPPEPVEEEPVITVPKAMRPKPEPTPVERPPPPPPKVFPDYPPAPECAHYWHVRPDGSRVCLNCDAVPTTSASNHGYRGVPLYAYSASVLNALDHPERCREERDYAEMPDPVRWVRMSDFHRRHRP